MMRQDRLSALTQIAGVKRDADLARLAGVSARLAALTRSHKTLAGALADEVAFATADPDVPDLRALDAHVILAEQALGRIETEIGRTAREREALRALGARSFGRAQVIGALCEQAWRRTRKPS